VLVPGIVVVDGPALFRHPRLGRLLSALLGRSGMVHARPTQLIALHCSLRRSCDRQPWGRVSLGAQPSLGGWVAFGLEPSSLLESGSGAFIVMGPGGLRWSRDAPRICRPMRLDDSTLSAARYWFILPLGMYIFTTSMPSFYYYVMSTPASATTPFTVPWGRGTGRRAGVLLTVPPSSFSCSYCTATFAFASATASSTVLEERRLYQRIGAALLPEFHLRQRFLNCPVGRELRLRACTTDSLLCDTVCAGVAADG
jgi:hypothetical protein